MRPLARILADPIDAELTRLADELQALQPDAAIVLDATVSALAAYDPKLFVSWQREGLDRKAAMYCLRYVLPCYELLRAEQVRDWKEVLGAELLSNVAWRAFDNCIDGHDSVQVAHDTSVASCLRLLDYVHARFGLNAITPVREHYRLMTAAAIQEGNAGTAFQDIWTRCSIFVFAPEVLAHMSAANLRLFKAYLNFAGLVHDVRDLLSDVSAGIVSLPVRWLREANEDGVLDVRSIQHIYTQAWSLLEPVEEEFRAADAERQLPVIAFVLREGSTQLRNGQLVDSMPR